ncbi:hypothetical protein BO97DRAFT_388770 [Aspergillus terreus]|uniref:Uncharacterized protein n=1 Tax=Aspergillus terreus TaxID=33178 RepID=A0A5M3Z3N1_ASPTE|nr:hypothetical protein ATETN484_0007069800 [Aspergillus terreus]GFF16664.1 hypothetical protein BO97DRAFT_388770 [Aspergillus terreus]
MDIYQVASIVLSQAYKTTLFIKGVISDVKSFEDDRAEIRLRLNVQLLTLRFFQRAFVDTHSGLLLPGKLELFIAQTVKELLVQMRQTLSEYELIAIKYGLATSETSDLAPNERPEELQETFLDRVRSKALSLKKVAYDWSLFDKKRLLKMLESYAKWAADLRNLMQHFSHEALARALGSNEELRAIGLEPVVHRRDMVDAKAPTDFQSLQGQLRVDDDSSVKGTFRLGQWTQSGCTSSSVVIVEYHEYEDTLRRDDLQPEEVAELKAPVRDLAWLLRNSSFGCNSKPTDGAGLDAPRVYALECVGYIDQPDEERHIFLYRLPIHHEAGREKLLTLHSFINAEDSETRRPLKRPSLNDRFNLAYCLALSLSNIHASKWVHKNIWSRGILLFLNTPTGLRLSGVEERRKALDNEHRIEAYLSDWGYARSERQGTDMASDFGAEPNLYRHPERQGKPTRQFQQRHDIYALGVVLLEIGLWVTMSRLMHSKIREADRTGRLPRAKKVASDLVALAQQGLPREMGHGYSQAVVTCLTANFEGDRELALELQKVVDVLRRGATL